MPERRRSATGKLVRPLVGLRVSYSALFELRLRVVPSVRWCVTDYHMSTRTTITGPDFVTVEQAAGLCQRHPESVRRWIRSGLLPAVKPKQGPGGRFLIRRDDLETLLTPRARP